MLIGFIFHEIYSSYLLKIKQGCFPTFSVIFLNYFDKSENLTRDFAQFVELYWYEMKVLVDLRKIKKECDCFVEKVHCLVTPPCRSSYV